MQPIIYYHLVGAKKSGRPPRPASPDWDDRHQTDAHHWAAEVTSTVGRELARHRRRLGWSAKDLEDMTIHIGYKVSRSVISKLEASSGKDSPLRPYVTITEILALAAALSIPPALLIFPVGYEINTSVLPKVSHEPYDALRWLSGRIPILFPAEGYELVAENIDFVERDRAAIRKVEHELFARQEAKEAIQQAQTPEEIASAAAWADQQAKILHAHLNYLTQNRERFLKDDPEHVVNDLPEDVSRAIDEFKDTDSELQYSDLQYGGAGNYGRMDPEKPLLEFYQRFLIEQRKKLYGANQDGDPDA